MRVFLGRVRRRLAADAELPDLTPLRERIDQVEADYAEERGLRRLLEDHVAALERRLAAAYAGKTNDHAEES